MYIEPKFGTELGNEPHISLIPAAVSKVPIKLLLKKKNISKLSLSYSGNKKIEVTELLLYHI